MYTKSLLVSALLAASAAATSPEVVAAAQPPAAYQTLATPSHEVMGAAQATGAHQTPAAQAYAPAAATYLSPLPPAPVAKTQPTAALQAAPPSGMGMQHQSLTVFLVSVSDSNGTLKYFPDTVYAAPGSVVQFQFHPKNHTVTESTFDAPCKAKDPALATPQRPGLRSGFVPITGSEDITPVFNVLINDTDPIWIFCGQQPHCIRGMSMVINPPNNPEKTIQKYQAAAAALPLPPAAAPPASSPPPPAGTGIATPPPPPPPPAAGVAAASSTSPTASPTAGSGAAANPAAAQPAPATFTGAASRTHLGLGALFLGAVAML